MNVNLDRFEPVGVDYEMFEEELLREINYYKSEEGYSFYGESVKDLFKTAVELLNNFLNAKNEQTKIEIMQEHYLSFYDSMPKSEIDGFMKVVLGIEEDNEEDDDIHDILIEITEQGIAARKRLIDGEKTLKDLMD